MMVEPLREQDKCHVLWRSNETSLPAVVVARRPLGFRKRKDTEETLPNVEDEPADKIEYYVHYLDHDRRLDEWVTLDKLQLDTLQRYDAEANIDIMGASSSDLHNAISQDDQDELEVSNRSMSSRHSLTRRTSNNENQPLQTLPSGGNWHGGNHHHSSHSDPLLAQYDRDHEEATKVKNIEKVIMGEWEIEAWYYSPFPESYSDLETLYVCKYCLTYMKKAKTYRSHKKSCDCRKPPGTEIYRDGDISVFELDGKNKAHQAYCQKLCLLAKLFLDHKTLYYDASPFYFYVIAKTDAHGSHIVGYFSKEKVSDQGYNLACILTFPQYQQSGYGKFIISLSYELTKREGKTGSPEKPLSDLGKVSYRSYWTYILMNLLSEHDANEDISITDISTATGIKIEDIISTLQSLGMVRFWKGQHVVYADQSIIDDYMRQERMLRLCKPECLHWRPRQSDGGSSHK